MPVLSIDIEARFEHIFGMLKHWMGSTYFFALSLPSAGVRLAHSQKSLTGQDLPFMRILHLARERPLPVLAIENCPSADHFLRVGPMERSKKKSTQRHTKPIAVLTVS